MENENVPKILLMSRNGEKFSLLSPQEADCFALLVWELEPISLEKAFKFKLHHLDVS
jgi:hypothetical protein